MSFRHLPRINQPSRINNIFGKTEISRRFRPQGESDGWADLFIGSPLVYTLAQRQIRTAFSSSKSTIKNQLGKSLKKNSEVRIQESE
ncbi:hypothetical protein COO91_07765 [Nostoc flagelliforme CCNUN1]|uniref:Uncharacterized protein n=1 Tax=Nostoc flagelliforme CCNUN1 TaxID=2038116 RepID=A0A2K8T261_9NOSO|nr:hypothetical protein [Nostoc flagelliforme]AUB41703.1 hypothetical protein COO91_07765 [Nostoc flagelliforme CCNUN1]